MTQKMCDKAVNTYHSITQFVPDCLRLKKCVIKLFLNVFLHLFIFVWVISKDPFLIAPNKYKNQKMCGKAVDDCEVALKFISDWFLTSEMLEKLDNALHANGDILFYFEDFDKVTLFACHRHILAVDLDKINLDDDKNFSEDDPDTLIHVRLLAGRNGFKKRKVLNKKIGEELMPIAWHPKRWWNFCMIEDEKKKK